MYRTVNIGLIGICVLLIKVSAGIQPAKERLTRDLLKDYQNTIDPCVISLEIGVRGLCFKFDKFTGILTGNVWEFMQWNDSRLSWNPKDYSGIDTLRIPAKLLWTPDIKLYSSLSLIERDTDVNTVVKSDGTVLWVPRATYRSYCTAIGDEATCKFRIGSWTYDGFNIILKQEGPDALDLSYYDEACPSVVASHTAAVVSHKYPCCEEPYPSLDITITVKPR